MKLQPRKIRKFKSFIFQFHLKHLMLFQMAARQDHCEAVALLVRWGACVNLKSADGGK
jgi:hypothetical protein